MAISVNREGNSDGTIDLTINIATTAFFNEFWERAIKEMNVKIFRENSHLGKNQLNEVLTSSAGRKDGEEYDYGRNKTLSYCLLEI